MIAIAALVFGLAGIGTPETFVKRVGSGAETVVLLDRSASMDAALVPLGQLPGVDKHQEPKKRKVARRAFATCWRATPASRLWTRLPATGM